MRNMNFPIELQNIYIRSVQGCRSLKNKGNTDNGVMNFKKKNKNYSKEIKYGKKQTIILKNL